MLAVMPGIIYLNPAFPSWQPFPAVGAGISQQHKEPEALLCLPVSSNAAFFHLRREKPLMINDIPGFSEIMGCGEPWILQDENSWAPQSSWMRQLRADAAPRRSLHGRRRKQSSPSHLEFTAESVGCLHVLQHGTFPLPRACWNPCFFEACSWIPPSVDPAGQEKENSH